MSLHLWAERELAYRATEHRGTEERDALRLTGPGREPWLFTAPHSVRSLRRGEVKAADMGTGGLAEALAELTGGEALTVVGRQTGDANWDVEIGAFKEAVLARLDRVVVDLHGFREERPEDLIIGLGRAPTPIVHDLAARLVRVAAGHGLTARTGAPFDATWAGTITTTVQIAGGTAIQVEVAGRCRRPRTRPAETAPLLAALLEWLSISGGGAGPRGPAA
ncbi:MAG: hypothetical protein NVS9B1_06030 [Candidatus Dormibacteraceae bacterium]